MRTEAAGRLPAASDYISKQFAAMTHHGPEQRKTRRVVFQRGYSAHMMALDGTWRRACTVHDVSEVGAKLSVEGTIEGMALREFFLLLSSNGLAYRRCELAWVNGGEISASFLKEEGEPGSAAALMRER